MFWSGIVITNRPCPGMPDGAAAGLAINATKKSRLFIVLLLRPEPICRRMPPRRCLALSRHVARQISAPAVLRKRFLNSGRAYRRKFGICSSSSLNAYLVMATARPEVFLLFLLTTPVRQVSHLPIVSSPPLARTNHSPVHALTSTVSRVMSK